MDAFSNKHLDSIGIQPDAMLILEYSEPDQGGTLLLHRYYISQKKEVSVEIGYSHDEHLRRKVISVEDVPKQIFYDALDWISQQLECKPSGRVLDVLTGLKKTLSSL